MPARWRATRLSRWSRHAARTRPISASAGADRRDDMREASCPAASFDPSRTALAGGEAQRTRRDSRGRPIRRDRSRTPGSTRLRDSGARIVQYRATERATSCTGAGNEVERLAGARRDRSGGARGDADDGRRQAGEGAPRAATRASRFRRLAGARRRGCRPECGHGRRRARASRFLVGGAATQFVELTGAEAEASRDPAVVAVEPYSMPRPLTSGARRSWLGI